MKYLTFFLPLFISVQSFSQDSLTIITKKISNAGFTDCISYKNELAALSNDGKIYQINLSDYSLKKISENGYSRIAVDRIGQLWAVDSFFNVYCFKDTGWKREKTIGSTNIWGILFTKSNNFFLLTDLGVYNSKTEMFYGTNKYNGSPFSMYPRIRYRTSCFFVDDYDNIWISSNSRLGKEVHVFSTKKNIFISSSMKGFIRFRGIDDMFGYKKTIFLSEYNNYGMSAIYSYKKDTMLKIHHYEYDTMTVGPSKEQEEYIGAAIFNKEDNSIYYYSNRGLQKAKYNYKKRKLEKAQVLTSPQYVWNGYEMETARFAMTVKKIFLLNNLIIYLNTEEGIYIYNGSRYYNLK